MIEYERWQNTCRDKWDLPSAFAGLSWPFQQSSHPVSSWLSWVSADGASRREQQLGLGGSCNTTMRDEESYNRLGNRNQVSPAECEPVCALTRTSLSGSRRLHLSVRWACRSVCPQPWQLRPLQGGWLGPAFPPREGWSYWNLRGTVSNPPVHKHGVNTTLFRNVFKLSCYMMFRGRNWRNFQTTVHTDHWSVRFSLSHRIVDNLLRFFSWNIQSRLQQALRESDLQLKKK